MSGPQYDVFIVTKTERYQVLTEVSRRCADRFQWPEGHKEIVLAPCSQCDYGRIDRTQSKAG
jgi:hypothetical protein